MKTLHSPPAASSFEKHTQSRDGSTTSAFSSMASPGAMSPGQTVRTAAESGQPISRAIKCHVTENQVCVLTFDQPDSSANVFNRETLSELNEHLDFISSQPALKGVVVTSAKKSIFIAGADLHALADLSGQELRVLIELGQSVFNRLATLGVPTVAAIHGACVGGGCELSLACDYRIASPDRATKIGLPETQLGILPAWGGCTRLPRLIGVPKALDIILAGKTLAPQPALKSGMVDELVPREKLLELACRRIASKGPGLRQRKRSLDIAATNNALMAAVIAARVRPRLLKKTRGQYPAVLKALEVVTQGISRSVEQSLALERDAILELAQSESCHNLIGVFLLQERAKKFSVKVSSGVEIVPPIERVAVIGAGVMGAGIAQWLSARGLPVILRDVNAEAVARGMANIAGLYAEGVKRHLFTPVEARAGLDRIYPSATEVPLRNVDLVIEAAVEKMDLKKLVFRRLDELAGPNTLLATNTSALSVSEIAGGTTRPERVVGIHFFNPVHRMQLVEVVAGRQSSPEAVQRAVRFVQRIGKLPLQVKDSPGFLVNRILMPYLIEAGNLFEAGARTEDIDDALLDFGMPMGPLRLIDEVGVDVARHVAETLAANYENRMRVPAVLAKMIETGLVGRKGGQGFYLHGGKKAVVNPQANSLQSSAGAAGFSRLELQQRMVLPMVNEAARCLEEGVVAEPADVDFGMIMGTGFAPFRGGPLRYADAVGAGELVKAMRRWVGSAAAHFQPCALLERQAANGEKFYDAKGGTP